MLLNVKDYPDVAAALADASDGDRVYVPSGVPYIAPAGGWQVTKSIDLYGDGPGLDASTGTILRAADGDSSVLRIVTPAANVRIRDLQLQRGGSGSGAGVGIVCQSSPSDPADSVGLTLSRLRVSGFPNHGIRLEGAADRRLQSVALLDLIVTDCGGSGVLLAEAIDVQALSCTFSGSDLAGLVVSGGSLAMKACRFSGNAKSAALSDPEEGNLKAIGCEMLDVDGCRFTGLQAGNIRKGIVCRDTTGFVGNCAFESSETDPPCTSILVRGGNGGPGVILGN
jgi:hypothetical protein